MLLLKKGVSSTAVPFSFQPQLEDTLEVSFLSSVEKLDLSLSLVRKDAMNVAHEVELLVQEIKRLGQQNSDGQYVVKFGVLFSDDRCANLFEALVGTLRAAKRKKIVKYDKELLLQGVDDNTDIVLLKED